MPKQHWLVKQEPDDYAWDRLVEDGTTAWTGIRNFQARNHLRAMKVGDDVLYYHTGDEKQVVGLARVERAAYPDPTASEGDWSCVDLAAVKPLPRPVTLGELKQDEVFRDLALLRQPRLSVMPVTEAQFRRIIALANRAPGRA
ncbi:MAG: EVE domain-containing protein [Verrucomicrobia bacterium]|jgi:predicted RNA-binding protein with PUA-like domain|nr:EVE domain-containing protein [Verrucomicrobiota bacterium]